MSLVRSAELNHVTIKSQMKINILTLFPDFFSSPLNSSILARAKEKGLVEYNLINIRDCAFDKHQITDERPFGGGAGMVMKVEPIDRALAALTNQGNKFDLKKKKESHRIILTSAKGKRFTQDVATDYCSLEELTIVCGHYEGVDERVAKYLVDEEVRIGDYVLTGGEPASLVIADAVTRLVPGVLGNEESLEDESHSKPGEFSSAQYTRPREYRSWSVPEVLLSGDHQRIEEWRREERG